MIRFIGRRLATALSVLVLSSIVVFAMSHLVPGDPVDAMVGSAGFQQASNRPELVAQIRHDLGLDRPLPVQYGRWALGALHGDLGRAYIRQRPVGDLIRERLPSTLELAALSLCLATVLGLTLGVIAALRNALIPVVTVIGLQVGHLLAGSVIIETVFARQGIGQLAVDAIRAKDYPLVQGIILFTAVVYVSVYCVVDLLYGYLDPQIRLAA